MDKFNSVILLSRGQSSNDGIIGNKFLKNYTITIDYKNQLIYFAKNIEILDFEYSFGFNYCRMNNKIVVSQVIENSDAFKKGIRVGDIIYSVNDIPTDDILNIDYIDYMKMFDELPDTNNDNVKIGILKDSANIEIILDRFNLFE
ncbi:MAG: PDZ domain-containing protein [Candidatus Delongbacteria bacterium]|nr:PDZ domain-containing protein [Candidatus Delongbacteria bacterium]MBN2833661.1 PDZ domain-containing protein [Candidatus Delongbacteria bacterium]